MQKHPRLAALGRRAGGLALIFVSMCLSSIGFVMQRKAHLLDEQQGSEHKERSHRQRPLWLLGVALYILAALPDVVAYTLIPQMLCSAVGCFRFVLVSVLGHFLLAERLGRQEVTGIVVCTLGALLCVGFGPGDESIPLYPGEVHGKKVTHYVCSGLVVLAAFLVVVHTNLLGPNSKLQVFSLPFTTALAYGLEKVFNSELTFVPKPEKVLQDDPMWLKLVVAVAFFGILDFYLNLRAAQRMPLHVYMPLSFAFGTLIQNYQGLFVFDEIKDMRVYHSALTIVGAASALAGALMIQPPQFNQVDKGSKEKSAGISEVVAEPL